MPDLKPMKSNGLYVNYRKWPDSSHWHFTVYSLGSDTHGVWYCLPDGSVIQRGQELPQTSRLSVMLLPKDAWWVAFWNTDRTKAHEVYIDVVKPVRSEPHEVTMIDLDLDVVRTWSGQVGILDQDEFELHQKTLQYPRDIVARAESTADLVAKLVSKRQEPFGAVGEAWRTHAAALSWPKSQLLPGR